MSASKAMLDFTVSALASTKKAISFIHSLEKTADNIQQRQDIQAIKGSPLGKTYCKNDVRVLIASSLESKTKQPALP